MCGATCLYPFARAPRAISELNITQGKRRLWEGAKDRCEAEISWF